MMLHQPRSLALWEDRIFAEAIRGVVGASGVELSGLIKGALAFDNMSLQSIEGTKPIEYVVDKKDLEWLHSCMIARTVEQVDPRMVAGLLEAGGFLIVSAHPMGGDSILLSPAEESGDGIGKEVCSAIFNVDCVLVSKPVFEGINALENSNDERVNGYSSGGLHVEYCSPDIGVDTAVPHERVNGSFSGGLHVDHCLLGERVDHVNWRKEMVKRWSHVSWRENMVKRWSHMSIMM
ncbi:unnamed protein product [Lupinus luteus]|uniref:Uncharacterized protein n=1 Tax=Lupinus luteus TaxID=3873 RepID=A0AAV1XPD3_LUPLU